MFVGYVPPISEGYGHYNPDAANYKVSDKDKQEALQWLRKAAEKGNVNAQFRLYDNYLSDYIIGGNPRDKSEAAKWLLKMAESNPEYRSGAERRLAKLEQGLPETPEEYRNWLRTLGWVWVLDNKDGWLGRTKFQ